MLPSWLRQFKKRFAGQSAVAPHRRKLFLERLEDRTVPATIRWTGGAVPDVDLDGNGHTNVDNDPPNPDNDLGESGSLRWSSPGNWDLGRPPQAGDDVVFPNITPPTSANYIAAYTTQRGIPTPHSVMDLNITINSLTILGPGPTTGGNAGWFITDIIITEPLTAFPVGQNNTLPHLVPDHPAIPATLTILGAVTYVGAGTAELDFQMRLSAPDQRITVTDPGGLLIIGNKGRFTNPAPPDLFGFVDLASSVNGDISNNPASTSAVGIVKDGPGTLRLGGNNSFDGLIEVQQGTLIAANNNALGLTGVGTVVRNGATLTVATGNLRESLQIEGVGIGGAGVLNGGGAISGGVALNASATIGGGLTISGVISGTTDQFGNIADLTSIGFLTLTNANTYLGATFVNANILTITNNDALSPGSFTAVANGASLSLFSSLTSGLRVVDDEMLFLNGQGFDPPDPAAPPVNPAIGALNSGGSIATRATPAEWRSRIFLETDASIGIDLLSTLQVTGQLSNLPISAAALASLSPEELDAFQRYLGFNRPTIQAADLTKRGRGEAIFPNANLDFAGDTFVRNGILVMQGPEVLGPATEPGVGGEIIVQFLINDPVTGLATLEFGTLEVQGQFTVEKNLTISGNGFNSLGALDITDNPNDAAPTVITWSAPIALVSEGATTVATITTDPTTTLTINGAGTINGTIGNALIKSGTGTLNLNTANSFLGTLTLRDGLTNVINSGAFGGLGGLGTTVSSGAVLSLSDGLVVVGEQLTLSSQLGISASLQVGNGINLWTGTVIVAGNNQVGAGDEVIINTTSSTGSLEFSGGVSGDAKIRKLGLGTMLFTGSTANTFVDTLQIEDGTVVLSKTPGPNGAVVNAVAGPIVVGDGQNSTPATNNSDVLRLGGPNQIPDSRAVTVLSTGLWDLNGFTEATGTVSLQGGEITTGTTGSLILTTNPATLGAPDLSVVTGNVFLGNVTRTFNFLPGPSATFSVNRNPAQSGTAITFTYTLSGGAGSPTPTGTVTFFDRTTNTTLNPGGAPVNASGTATFVTNALGVGSHVIEGRYSGDANYANQTVTLNEPVVVVNPSERPTLTTSANPTPPGQFVTFTFTLPFNTGNPRPGGTVMFFDGNTQIGPTQTLSSGGVASVTTTTLAIGSHTIRAVYSGDGTYSPIEVTLANQLVGQPAVLDLSTSTNPATTGTPLTFTFRASPLAGDPTPTGTVQFFDTFNNVTTALSSVLIVGNDGTATFTTSTLAVGSHTITARYSGDTTLYLPGIATLSPAQVVGISPLLRISSSNNPSVNQNANTGPVTFTVNLNGDTGEPVVTGGTVTFRDNGGIVGVVPVSGGVATLTLAANALAVGSHTIRADFSGNTFYGAGSVTLAQNQIVVPNPNPPANTAVIIVSSNNNTSESNEAVTFTTTIYPAGGGALPTGNIQFFDTFTINGVTQTVALSGIQTVVQANGVATSSVTVSNLRVGTHTITAQYTGGNYGAGTFTMTPNQIVVNPVFGSVVVNQNPAVPGSPVTLTFNSTLFPGAPAFGGTIRFLDGGTGGQLIGTSQLLDANGSASVVATNLSPGPHTITVQYIPPSAPTGFNPDYAGFFVNLAPSLVVGSPPAFLLSSSSNPAVSADVIAFTFSAIGDPGAPIPNGTVQFFDNGVAFPGGAITLVAGTATAVTNSLTPGPHVITARYSGDGNYAAGTVTLSPDQVVRGTPSQQLTSDANPVAVGANVTFTYIINRVSGADPLPSGTVMFFDGNTQIGATQNLTQNLNGATASLTTNGLTLGTHTIRAVYSGDATYQPSTLTFQNQVVSNPPVPPISPPPTVVTSFSPNLQVNGVISGGAGAGVTKIGTGQMILNGVNTYTGPTTVNGVNGSLVLGVNNALPDTPVTVTAGTLNINGVTDAVSSITGAAAGILALGTGSFTVGSGNTSTTFAGPITGTGTLTKVGTGTLTLSGVSPAYTGTTAVASGTVLVTAAQGGAAVTVANGAILGGTGPVGPITTSVGGTVAPGTAGAGILNATGAQNLAGGTLAIDVNGTTVGTQYDRLAVAGTANITGTVLSLSLGFTPAIGNTFTVLTTTGGITGTFVDTSGNPIAEGGGFAVNGGRYTVSYAGGNAVVTYRGLDLAGTLTSSANPTPPATPITFTLSIPAAASTGTVNFVVTGPGATTPPSVLNVPVVSGVAQATFTFNVTGVYTVTATYSGNGTLAQKDFVLSETVNFATSTTISTSAAQIQAGQSATFTATVSSTAGTPTGTVTFVNVTTGATLGTVALNGAGSAALTVPFNAVGTSTIRAVYSGDTTFRTSSADVIQIVNRKPPFYTNATVIGNFLVLEGNGVPGGVQIIPVASGSQAFFTDVNGDGDGDVVLVLPNLILVADGATGRILALAADVNSDGVRDLLIFNPDGTTTTTDGKTGRVTIG